MIDPIHLKIHVIEPVNKHIGLSSLWADNLILGTACVESECGRWLYQRGGGPALGIFQMEPDTHEDCWKNFLLFRKALAEKVLNFTCYHWPQIPYPQEMIGNLNYAAAMARIKYLRDPAPIPTTLGEQAVYWKRVYNTEKGDGRVEDYIKRWDRFVPAGAVRFHVEGESGL